MPAPPHNLCCSWEAQFCAQLTYPLSYLRGVWEMKFYKLGWGSRMLNPDIISVSWECETGSILPRVWKNYISPKNLLVKVIGLGANLVQVPQVQAGGMVLTPSCLKEERLDPQLSPVVVNHKVKEPRIPPNPISPPLVPVHHSLTHVPKGPSPKTETDGMGPL